MLIYFEILWNLLKLFAGWIVIVSNLLKAYRILTHTDKTPIAPISMDGKDGGEGGAINQSEEIRSRESKTEKGRNRESKQSQNRASKTEKGRNRESKQSQNRASKTEKGRKPIVKTRGKSKADSQSPKTSQKPRYSRNNHCKTRQIHKNTNRKNRQNSQQRILEKHVHIMHSSRHNCAPLMM